MPAAIDVLKVAVKQIGICEKPAGSNKVKYNTWFYGHPVRGEKYAWCATFLDWCFEKAGCGKLYPHNANAADAQDDIVSRCGGSWIMKKNRSRDTRKAYLKKAKPGDIVCFDFGAMDAYRWHTGIVEAVSGNYLICIEGNTSKTGSQSNGGMVVRQRRLYTSVCSAARPKFDGSETPEPKPVKPTVLPVLPKRGWFHKGDKGPEVMKMQNILVYLGFDCGIYGADGVLGSETQESIERFEKKYGLTQDGEWGKKCNAKAADLLGLEKPKAPTPQMTKTEKIIGKAVEYAYPAGTDKSKYDAKRGKPKESYAKALNKIFPKHKSWKKEIREGASCSVFVATAVRASGADTKFMCDDPPKVMDYMSRSQKYVKQNTGRKPVPLSKMKPGDIIVYEKPGANGSGHILLYKGDGYIMEANYNRCYPHTSKIPKAYLNEAYINNTYRRFAVYRVKE